MKSSIGVASQNSNLTGPIITAHSITFMITSIYIIYIQHGRLYILFPALFVHVYAADVYIQRIRTRRQICHTKWIPHECQIRRRICYSMFPLSALWLVIFRSNCHAKHSNHSRRHMRNFTTILKPAKRRDIRTPEARNTTHFSIKLFLVYICMYIQGCK